MTKRILLAAMLALAVSAVPAQAITKRMAIRKTRWQVAAMCVKHGCNEALLIDAHCAGPFSGLPWRSQWNCDAWNFEKHNAGACHYWIGISPYGKIRFINRDCFGISQNSPDRP
jgi:hypothetical protein